MGKSARRYQNVPALLDHRLARGAEAAARDWLTKSKSQRAFALDCPVASHCQQEKSLFQPVVSLCLSVAALSALILSRDWLVPSKREPTSSKSSLTLARDCLTFSLCQ